MLGDVGLQYEQWPYLAVLGVLLLASLGLPLPEDVPLLTAGYLCHIGAAELLPMIAVGMLGVLCGDVILFSLGRRFGEHVVELPVFRRVFKPHRLLLAEQLFARHGVKIVFAGRFLPGLRPMIFMAGGVLKLPFRVFILVNGFAACISVPTLILLGKVFGEHLEQIQNDVRRVTHYIVLAIILAGLTSLGIYLHRRQKRLLATVATSTAAPISSQPEQVHSGKS